MPAMQDHTPNIELSTSEMSNCSTVLSDARIRWHCRLRDMYGWWLSAMSWLMWLCIGRLCRPVELACFWLGCHCSGSLAAKSQKCFKAVV